MNEEKNPPAMGRSVFNWKLIVGLLIIIAGIIALLQGFGWDIPLSVWDFWPLIFIIIGLSKLFQPKEYRNTLGAIILLLIGLLFLLSNFDLFRFGFNTLWPIILILFGIMLIKQAFWSSKSAPFSNDFINLSFILGGGKFNFMSQQLKGGNVIAIMGGGTINLTDADIQNDAIVIETFALMGGIEIIAPQKWQVIMQGIPILGGMDNKTVFRPDENAPQTQAKDAKKLIIKGMAIMGGVEVKN